MASFGELAEVLHPLTITEQYKEDLAAYPKNPLVEFFSKGMKQVSGDKFEFVYVGANKTPAPSNLRGAPARVLQPLGLSDREIVMFHSFNEMGLAMEALQMIRNPNDQTLQNKGREEIGRQMEGFGNRQDIFRAVVLSKTLFNGEVYINNTTGMVEESSSASTTTVDWEIPANNKNQLNGIIGTAWDNAASLILDDIEAIQMVAEENNSEPIRHAWAPPEAKQWLRNNTQLNAFVTGGGSPMIVDRMLKGETIEDLGGITWHFYGGTYTNTSGTSSRYIPANKILFTPDPGPWLKGVEGSELVPTYEGITAGVDEALNSMTEIFGRFGYCKVIDNPVKLVLRLGDNFAWAPANVNSIFQAVVDF